MDQYVLLVAKSSTTMKSLLILNEYCKQYNLGLREGIGAKKIDMLTIIILLQPEHN